jgi:hypothetical protein
MRPDALSQGLSALARFDKPRHAGNERATYPLNRFVIARLLALGGA